MTGNVTSIAQHRRQRSAEAILDDLQIVRGQIVTGAQLPESNFGKGVAVGLLTLCDRLTELAEEAGR